MACSLQLNVGVRRITVLTILCAGALALCASSLRAEGLQESSKKFVYKDASGQVTSVKIIRHYWTKPIVRPFAKIDPRLDPKLARAATLAQERAHAESQAACWHYVKHALFSAGVIDSYPKTAYAAEAGDELMHSYGFKRLPIHDPYAAPVGASGRAFASGLPAVVVGRDRRRFAQCPARRGSCGARAADGRR